MNANEACSADSTPMGYSSFSRTAAGTRKSTSRKRPPTRHRRKPSSVPRKIPYWREFRPIPKRPPSWYVRWQPPQLTILMSSLYHQGWIRRLSGTTHHRICSPRRRLPDAINNRSANSSAILVHPAGSKDSGLGLPWSRSINCHPHVKSTLPQHRLQGWRQARTFIRHQWVPWRLYCVAAR